MPDLLVLELLPQAYAPRRRLGPTQGLIGGAGAMLALDLLLGV